MAEIRHNSGLPRGAASLAARRAVLCAVAAAMLGSGGIGAPTVAIAGEHKARQGPTAASTATATATAIATATATGTPDAAGDDGDRRDGRDGRGGRGGRENGRGRGHDRERASRETGGENGRQTRVALLPELGRARSAAPWEAAAATESIRPRGAAAPVALQDVRDGESGRQGQEHGREFGTGGSQRGAARQPGKGGAGPGTSATRSEDKPLHGRIWPMPGGTYTFTQEFGCVEQIGGFYPTAAECPPERPVVHRGIDLAADTGALIYAAASGWVTEAGYDRDTGLANTRLVIQHDGRNGRYATEYLHWIATFVELGDYVRVGQPVAEVGSVGWSTGPHLHFAVIDFERGEYVDPLGWLPGRDSSAYRDLPRNPRPVRFDDAESGDSTLPDAADPNPAPIPERTDTPASRRQHAEQRAEEKQAAREEAATAARADRKNERLVREADRDERAAERRKRIRHADGETAAIEDTGATGTSDAGGEGGEGGEGGKRRDGRDGTRNGNGNGNGDGDGDGDGKRDGGRRDQGTGGNGERGSRHGEGNRSGGDSGDGTGTGTGTSDGDGGEEAGGGRDGGQDAGDRKRERSAEIDGEAGGAPAEAPEDTGVSSRVAALLETMP